MITFDEFLVRFSSEVQEVYESVEMSGKAKKAVVLTMRQHLGNKRFDPISILNLFQSVCYAAMSMGRVNRRGIENKVNNMSEMYLSGPEDFYTPGINFVEIEESRVIGR